MKTCLIITGGSIDIAFAGSFLRGKQFDVVIVADSGLEAAKALSLMPDAVVGDFDSVSADVLEEFQHKKGIAWDIHKPEKNETDTELAVFVAFSRQCTSLTILGATGGRFDHTMGNLHLLYTCMLEGVDASMIDGQNKIYLLNTGKEFRREEVWGSYLSFLPLTPKVLGITLHGFRYPLNQKDIEIGKEAGLCISNELAEDVGSIEFSEGVLICVESHD